MSLLKHHGEFIVSAAFTGISACCNGDFEITLRTASAIILCVSIPGIYRIVCHKNDLFVTNGWIKICFDSTVSQTLLSLFAQSLSV